MSAVERCEVAIAGAGPVGTVMATLLAKAGVSVVLIEAGPDCAQDLRASTFHPPTLEMLDEIGITSMLLERGLKAPLFTGAIALRAKRSSSISPKSRT